MDSMPPAPAGVSAVDAPSGAPRYWRIPAFYFIHFFGVGVFLPFLNVFYHAIGIGGLQLGLLNAAPRLVQSVAPPILGAVADKYRRGREVLLVCAGLGVAIAAGLWIVRSFWPLLILIAAFSMTRGSIVPIAENVCLRDLKVRGGQYGRMRWWGSFGFILAALAGGWLIDRFSITVIFPVVVASGGVLVGVLFFFPREGGEPLAGFRGALGIFLKSRPLFVFLSTSLLVSFSAGPFGIYFSIYLRELGMPAGFIGLAWTVGVVSEIFFLVFAEAIQRRVGLKTMIAAGMFAAALRWEMITWSQNSVFVLAVQALHGIHFGVYHAAAVQYLDALSPAATKNTAQSLYSSATFGVGASAGALIAGALLPLWGFSGLLHAGAAVALIGALGFVAFSGGGQEASR
ncbi:MAG: MFS transporter [bacterium]|nr:MFS transporter [bacterium]